MKGIMLLYGVSMLVIGYAMMVDAKRANPFSMCSITEEKDAALYKCLSDYRVKQREAMEKIKNHAGVKNHTLLYQLFKDSLKCFSDKSRTQKFCYLRAMGQRFRQNYPRKGEEMEIISAAVMYESFKGYTKSMMEECKLNQETAPFFVSCLQDIDPEAKKIMAEKVSHESYKRMVELMISTKRCYMNLTSDQLACIVKQSQDYQKGQVEKMKKDMQLMVEKLKDCKINEEKIEAVLACVKPKANEMMKKAMKLFEQPELIDEVWNISEDMKQCFDKYPDVKKCSNLQKHGRSEKHGPRMLNPFHFENVTNGLLHYIQVKSKNMLRDCKVRPTEMPSLFVCLAKKYKENKDVQSTDPKKKFIGMMMLMNTSAECFKNVTAEQGVCLWKNKQDMIRFVNFNAQSLGKIMDQLLGACNATSEMVSCVDAKKSRLQELAKTILTNPDVAETMWDLGASLKNCLTDATIRTCVLSKKDKSQERFGRRGCSSHECYGDMNMQKHIVEKSKKMLAECNLSPENSPAVFVCLKRKFDESKMKSLKDPKEIFISGMMLMNTSASCFKNATSEQKRCLLNKKNEMQEKISETSEKFQKVMDGILLSCGVSKNNTPDLVECIQPKRESLMKLIPDLLNDPATAEPVWDLMEEAKKCFESKPEIGKCLKQKNMAYFMAKFGKKKDFVPRMEIMGKVKMMLKKCNISVESTPNVYACMQTKVDNLKDLMRSKDMSPAEKMVEFSKMRKEGLKCLENDEKRQKCVEETSRSFIKVVAQKFRMPPGGFDVNTVMKRMDGMLAGCGITSEKTPQLKSCLDERTDAVMKIKPWLPMDNEAREKLKAEGVKYWKCFGDGQGEELQCMKKIVDGFKTQGKAFAERMKKISGSVDKKINDLLQNVTNEVLVCSPNKCFEKNVKAAFEESKDYWKFMKASKKEEVERLKKNIANSLVQGMFCLQNLPTFEQAKTFTCLQPIINKTSLVVNEMIQKWNKGNSKRWDKSWGVKEGKAEELQRKKRDTEEEEQEDEEKEETGFLFVSFLNYPPQSTDDSSVDAFQSLLDKQSVERIQAFFNLMKNFLSKCTSWGPPPQDMTDRKIIDHGGLRRRSSRQIIDHGGLPARPPPPSDMMDKFVPPAQIGEDYGRCKLMYDSIKSFVNNGKMMGGQQQPKEIHHHLSTSVIVAACIGSVIVVVLILLTIMVIFVTRRSCNSHNHQSSPASAPQEPSTTVSFPPKETPPSYNEIHDKGNCATDAVYSQVLDTSTRGGTEKSC